MSTATHPRGAISTSHHLATEAGAAAIEAGGTAVDAALAAAAALCVAYPNNVALGGDLVALVRSPDGEVHFLNGTGTAPANQTLEALRVAHGDALPTRGIDTVTVPGGVCGWNSLHELGAKLSWQQHFEAAIRHAKDGVLTAPSVAAAIAEHEEMLAADPGCREIFLPNGTPLTEADLLVQPALAETLSRLAEHGSIDFYAGETGRTWISALQQLGSKITLEDSIDFNAQWETPIEGTFAGHRIVTSPPNTSGFVLLRALQALGAGIEDPLGTGAGELARAFQTSNEIRAAHLADPRFGGMSGDDLIAMTNAAGDSPAMPVSSTRSKQSDSASNTETTTRDETKPSGDTVGLSAVTADGWAISLINSIYHGFGSGVLEPQTGIIFQNRGMSFSLDPASPNAFAGGKRPRHTLMPVLVFEGDNLVLVPATMGGSAQPQIHTQLLLRALNGASPAEATHAPRFAVKEPKPDGEVVVTVEADVTEQARQAIVDAGFAIETVPPHSEGLGHSNLIRVTTDGYAAASDPRSDGSAIVVPPG